MALINTKGNYIKLKVDGSYEVYTSGEARDRVKTATSSEVILTKYRELIANLEKPELAEFRYYDLEGFAAMYDPLVKEYRKYSHNLNNYITGNEYPIMAEIYSDVADSIPEIVDAACIPHEYKDVEEAYLVAKRLKRFGETIDA